MSAREETTNQKSDASAPAKEAIATSLGGGQSGAQGVRVGAGGHVGQGVGGVLGGGYAVGGTVAMGVRVDVATG